LFWSSPGRSPFFFAQSPLSSASTPLWVPFPAHADPHFNFCFLLLIHFWTGRWTPPQSGFFHLEALFPSIQGLSLFCWRSRTSLSDPVLPLRVAFQQMQTGFSVDRPFFFKPPSLLVCFFPSSLLQCWAFHFLLGILFLDFFSLFADFIDILAFGPPTPLFPCTHSGRTSLNFQRPFVTPGTFFIFRTLFFPFCCPAFFLLFFPSFP